MNIYDQNRKHQQFLYQRLQDRIDRQRLINSQVAQERQRDVQRQVQAILDDLQRRREQANEQANLDFQRKENKNQRKDHEGLPRQRQHQNLLHKLTDKLIDKYEKDEDFQRIIDEGIKKVVTALMDGYSRWKETAASGNAHPPGGGFPIVDNAVEVTWDDLHQKYRMAKDREQP
jgi:hypothetical protein